jgi:hypothetical protein
MTTLFTYQPQLLLEQECFEHYPLCGERSGSTEG